MHTRTLTAAVIAAPLLLLAGCTSLGSSVNTTAANTGAAAAKTTAAAAKSAKPAGLGDTVDVTDASGNKLAVTLVKVDPKAASTDGFSTPDAGKAYYAAQFQIKDVGSTAWSDAADNCVKIGDASGQQFQADIVSSISSGPMFPDTVNLAAGGVSLGWVVFQVPAGDTISAVQFTPDSGMADSTAQWSVG